MPQFFDKYWQKRAADWENTIHENYHSRLGFIERIAGFFRKNIHIDRRDAVTRYISDDLRGHTVVDLGCAGGYLCYELLQAGARKVIGIDISPSAIDMANQRFNALKVPVDRFSFLVESVNDPHFSLPECDYVVSLGFLEYLSLLEIEALLEKAKGKRLFMAYVNTRRWNPAIRVCYYIYRKLKKFPSITEFTAQDLETLLAKHGFSRVKFYISGANAFFHAFPAPEATCYREGAK